MSKRHLNELALIRRLQRQKLGVGRKQKLTAQERETKKLLDAKVINGVWHDCGGLCFSLLRFPPIQFVRVASVVAALVVLVVLLAVVLFAVSVVAIVMCSQTSMIASQPISV